MTDVERGKRDLEEKISHVRLCAEAEVEATRSPGFDRYRLAHDPLPEIDLDEVDTRCVVLGRSLAAPLLVAPMSGGIEPGRELTRTLARVAQSHRIALGVGSQRIGLERPELADGFAVRDLCPDALVFANLGAVNLRLGLDADDCLRAVEMAGADALFLHVNPLQEAIQRGDTCFGDLLGRIGEVCQALGEHDVPVLVREVSFGMPAQAARRLRARGVAGVDTGGCGGTSWAAVEGQIASDPVQRRAGEVFRNWGLTTCESLDDLVHAKLGMTLVATGGLRTGVDLAKVVALGADLGGFALPFLRAFMADGERGADLLCRQLLFELRLAMFASGARELGDLGARLIRTDRHA